MNDRQRLAWVILLGSFLICATMALIIPFSINTILQQATRPLTVEVQANQGTVGILQNGIASGALFAGDEAQEVDPGSAILTNANDTAIVLIFDADRERLLARLQVYGGSNLQLSQATSSRFDTGKAEDQLALTLTTGRINLTVPEDGTDQRPFLVQLNTPQSQIEILQAGQYSLQASAIDSQLAVQQGAAFINGDSGTLSLVTDQRAVMSAGAPPQGPLDTERNLIENSNFNRELDGWVQLSPNVEREDQPGVELSVRDIGGESAVAFSRLGVGHADVSLRQVINEDVTDFSNLFLVTNMRIEDQSLGVCGQQGSECPLLIRIEYVDMNGIDRTWQQGFYAIGEIGSETPDVCVPCSGPLNPHLRVNFGQIAFYESDNLMERLAQENILPRHITAITLTASGHSFETEVLDITLLAQE